MASSSKQQQDQQHAAPLPPPRRMPSYALFTILLVPLIASCYRLGIMTRTSMSMHGNSDINSDSNRRDRQRKLGQRQQQRQSQIQAPFLSGVASGDPLADAVIIWTRLTLDSNSNTTTQSTSHSVTWKMSTSQDFTTSNSNDNTVLAANGSATTTADQDYTIKIDVTGLQPYTFYYYQFTYCNDNDGVNNTDTNTNNRCVDSVIGRTKTAPSPSTPVQQLRFATVSCSSYQWGYFHAYDRIRDRSDTNDNDNDNSDIDAVLHLGDYIYEYGDGEFGSVRSHSTGSNPTPAVVSLQDYRTRYAQYRQEAALRDLHQIQPFISTWDDHEFANNAHSNGANPEQHNSETQGAWMDRRRVAAQAYREWLPFRIMEFGVDTDDTDGDTTRPAPPPWTFNLYRKLSYGNLVDLFVLDNRMDGRDKQAGLAGQLLFLPGYYDDDRNLLGATQMEWIKNCLSESKAQWKVLVQPILLAPVTVTGLIAHNNDAWDGYTADRAELMGFIDTQNIDNVVILAGDIHATIISDIPRESTVGLATYGDWLRQFPSLFWNPSAPYESIAVEFAVTSVSAVTILEDGVLGSIPYGIQFADFVLQTAGRYLNPHGKYIESLNRGYQIVDFQTDKVQTNIYFTGTPADKVDNVPADQQYQTSFFSLSGDNFVQESSVESVLL